MDRPKQPDYPGTRSTVLLPLLHSSSYNAWLASSIPRQTAVAGPAAICCGCATVATELA